jgi:hypothetical protein
MDEATIQRLGLAPHPEGGQYRELFRSGIRVSADVRGLERSAMTAIHFLLRAGEFSRWHRVRSEELWHHAAGGPLELLVMPPDMDRVERVVLGPIASIACGACGSLAGRPAHPGRCTGQLRGGTGVRVRRLQLHGRRRKHPAFATPARSVVACLKGKLPATRVFALTTGSGKAYDRPRPACGTGSG